MRQPLFTAETLRRRENQFLQLSVVSAAALRAQRTLVLDLLGVSAPLRWKVRWKVCLQITELPPPLANTRTGCKMFSRHHRGKKRRRGGAEPVMGEQQTGFRSLCS